MINKIPSLLSYPATGRCSLQIKIFSVSEIFSQNIYLTHLRGACLVWESLWESCRQVWRRKVVLSQRRRQCGVREVWGGASQTWWAGWGTGSGSTPPGRTGTSPAAALSRGERSGLPRLKIFLLVQSNGEIIIYHNSKCMTFFCIYALLWKYQKWLAIVDE